MDKFTNVGTASTAVCTVRVMLTESIEGGTVGAYLIERCLPGETRWRHWAEGVYSIDRRPVLLAQVVDALHSLPVPLPFD